MSRKGFSPQLGIVDGRILNIFPTKMSGISHRNMEILIALIFFRPTQLSAERESWEWFEIFFDLLKTLNSHNFVNNAPIYFIQLLRYSGEPLESRNGQKSLNKCIQYLPGCPERDFCLNWELKAEEFWTCFQQEWVEYSKEHRDIGCIC